MLTARKENACRIAAVARTNAAIGAMVDVPGYEYRGWVGVLDALEPWHMTPEQMATRIRTDYEKQGKLIKFAGVRQE